MHHRLLLFAKKILVMTLIGSLIFPPVKATAGWRNFDSPAALTNGDPIFIEQARQAGDVFRYLAPAMMYGVIAYHADLEGFYQGTAVLGLSLGTMFILKNSVQRKRPNGADYQSFPSGHIVATMAPAAFISFRYGFWESIPFWGMGIFTAYSRVAARRHFITDALGSTAISILFTMLFTTPYGQEQKFENTSHIYFNPVSYDNGGFGFSIGMDF